MNVLLSIYSVYSLYWFWVCPIWRHLPAWLCTRLSVGLTIWLRAGDVWKQTLHESQRALALRCTLNSASCCTVGDYAEFLRIATRCCRRRRWFGGVLCFSMVSFVLTDQTLCYVRPSFASASVVLCALEVNLFDMIITRERHTYTNTCACVAHKH